jgi:PAS domain S-box-containing protein
MVKKRVTRGSTSTVRSLRRRLQEANDTIAAIREGHVDALVMRTPEGEQIYTLRTADQPYRLMVEQMAEGALTLSADGAILYCNARFAEMLGQSPVGIVGQTFETFVSPDDRAHTQALLSAAAFRHECRLLTAHGTSIPAQLSGAALFIEEVRSIAVVVSDLTQERSERALRESNRLKDEFLATLSHELRTPLNVIIGWTHILLSDQLSPDMRRRALELVDKNAQAQAQIVADLVDMSRITTGKLSLDLVPLPLLSALQTALDSMRLTADAKGVSLVLTPPADETIVLADATRLQQILVNLLSNAVKFTDAGGHVAIRVHLDGDQVQIEVTDSGMGIDPDFLPHVFDRFRQGDSGMTRTHGGLGLGLAVVHELIRLHGGIVQASSAGIGRGATFLVKLPRAERVSPKPVVTRIKRSNRNLDGKSILLLEDHEDTRDLTAQILQQVGVSVLPCASAAEAFALLQDRIPSAIVADIGLPDEDGISFIRRLRQHASAALRDLPAIAVTAYTSSAEQQQALMAGFHRHLAKPVDPGDLIDALCEVIDPSLR